MSYFIIPTSYTWKIYTYIQFLKSGNANNVSIKKMFINSQRSIIFNSFSRFDSYEVKVYLLSIYIQKKIIDQLKSDLWFRRKKSAMHCSSLWCQTIIIGLSVLQCSHASPLQDELKISVNISDVGVKQKAIFIC